MPVAATSLTWGAVAGLVGVIALVAAAVAGFLRVRGQTRDAIEEISEKRIQEARDFGNYWRENSESLLEEVSRLKAALLKTTSEKASLERATNLTSLSKEMADMFSKVADRLDRVDSRLIALEETHREMVAALQRIAKQRPSGRAAN